MGKRTRIMYQKIDVDADKQNLPNGKKEKNPVKTRLSFWERNYIK